MPPLPENIPFVLRSDAQQFNNSEMFPNNMYCRSQLQQQQPRNIVDMNTLGLFTAMAQNQDISKEDNENDIHIHVDMGLFTPEELTVQIVNDHIVIEGKHEERHANDISYVSRQFIRRYELPKDYNPDAMTSKLSRDGILRVLWPKNTNKSSQEHMSAIQQEDPNVPITKKNKTINVAKDEAMNEDEDQEEEEVGEKE